MMQTNEHSKWSKHDGWAGWLCDVRGGRSTLKAGYAESEMVEGLGHLSWLAFGFITNGHQREPSPRLQQCDLPKCHFLRARNPGSSSVALAGNDDVLPDWLRCLGVCVRLGVVHEG